MKFGGEAVTSGEIEIETPSSPLPFFGSRRRRKNLNRALRQYRQLRRLGTGLEAVPEKGKSILKNEFNNYSDSCEKLRIE